MSKFGESSYHRFSTEDQMALENWIRTYADSLVRFAYCYVKNSAVAEDVTADVFAALLVKRKRFESEDAFRAYLFKAVRNRSVDYLRRHQKEVPLSDVENVLSRQDAESGIAKQQRNDALYTALQMLPKQYREVLTLSYLEGFSIEEVCKIMKRTSKQVYNLLARSRIALRELLEKEGFSYEDL